MAHEIFVKKNGNWKKIKGLFYKKENTWKRIKKGWFKKGDLWKLFYAEGQLTKGMIIPFMGDEIPEGWQEFKAARNRLIMGADSTLPSKTAGGDWQAAYEGYLNTAGSHQGQLYDWHITLKSDGDCQECVNYSESGGITRGGHAHSAISALANIEPENTSFKLIKCISNHGVEIPKNGIIFSAENLPNTGLTQLTNYNNRYFSSTGVNEESGHNDGSVEQTVAFSTSTDGVHDHGEKKKTLFDSGGNGWYWIPSGAHYHTGELKTVINQKFKHTKLAIWEASSTPLKVPIGAIVMIANNNIPDGWVFCDGQNGTPDLRNRFIIMASDFDDPNEVGHSEGNNRISFQIQNISTVSHTHDDQRDAPPGFTDDGFLVYTGTEYTTSQRHQNNISHTHTGAMQVKKVLPRYYTLNFIMRKY